jgi:hypothetical protein
MDTLDSKTPEQPASSDVQQQFESLRHLVVSLLVLTIVVSGTLNIFFLRQWRDAKREREAITPQFTKMAETYDKTEHPMIQTVVNRLAEYAKTHPDYAPIAQQYKLNQAATPAASAPAAAPAAPQKK